MLNEGRSRPWRVLHREEIVKIRAITRRNLDFDRLPEERKSYGVPFATDKDTREESLLTVLMLVIVDFFEYLDQDVSRETFDVANLG